MGTSSRGSRFRCEVAIGTKRPTEKRREALDIATFRQHAVGQEALAHHAHVVGHPGRHELFEVLLECRSITAAIVDLASKNVRPDGGNTRSSVFRRAKLTLLAG